MNWISRLLPHRRPPRTVELDPIDQTILHTLARFGDCTFQRLHAELEVVRGATPAQTVLATVKLELHGLLKRPESVGIPLQPAAPYHLTASGRRVARHLPNVRASRIEFRL